MGYIYINIFPEKLQFAAYGQFVLVSIRFDWNILLPGMFIIL